MYSDILNYLPADRLLFNEEMKNHTTFRIGGPVDVMVIPQDEEDVRIVISFCKKNNFPLFIFGMGSNLLVRDGGIRGIAIKLGDSLDQVEVVGEEILAQAGVRLSTLARIAAFHSLSGLEFAEGIPGSLGGALVMNAGAYDGEIKEIVVEATAISSDGFLKTFRAEEMQFSYRQSIFQNNGYTILTARLKLNRGNRENIEQRMCELAYSRNKKQPLDKPSAGSTFRRPQGYFVGPMLEEMGLKGYRIGGAEVSPKHAGFIVNVGDATANDVLQLIAYIKEKAKEHFGVELQTEIKVVGE
ncbi:MAG: UDP-N-acetylmuramate dehydrogenase [Syntrophomonadaceae bacterium]|jgi:UDP-N-acetylmuramate dehydrogenase